MHRNQKISCNHILTSMSFVYVHVCFYACSLQLYLHLCPRAWSTYVLAYDMSVCVYICMPAHLLQILACVSACVSMCVCVICSLMYLFFCMCVVCFCMYACMQIGHLQATNRTICEHKIWEVWYCFISR